MQDRDIVPSPFRIGLMLDASTSYGRTVHTGIRRYLLPRPEFVVQVGGPDPALARGWRDADLDGAIVHCANAPLAAAWEGWDRPLVNTSGALDLPWPRVGLDDRAIGALAADYFLARRYRHFAYLGIPGRAYDSLRHEGFSQALTTAGWTCARFDMDRQRRDDAALASWLRSQPQPLACLALGDEQALHATQACVAARLGVPEPFAILAGVHDEQTCSAIRPSISGLGMPGERIGELAAQLLHRLLRGQAAPKDPLLVPPARVIERESTAAEAIADPAVAAAVHHIRTRLNQQLGVAEVVAASGLGRRTLEQRFISVLGISIYQHILQLRLSLAKSLLANTDDGLEAIASACGFAGPQHLCEVFRSREGITPGQYRQRLG